MPSSASKYQMNFCDSPTNSFNIQIISNIFHLYSFTQNYNCPFIGMVRKRNILLFLVAFITLIFVLINLGGFKKYIILGNWVGAHVAENGNSIKMDWSKVKFTFKLNGDYSYTNPSEYTEHGKYKLEKNMLITQPSNIQTNQPVAVEIIQLRLTSLILRMNDSGNEIILKLKRL